MRRGGARAPAGVFRIESGAHTREKARTQPLAPGVETPGLFVMRGKMNSVLLIRLSAFGDVIHTLPALEALRRALPGARLGWVVEEPSAPLLEGHPALDRLYVIPRKRWRAGWWRVWTAGRRRLWREEIRPFFQQMRAEGWEAAVDFQGLTKSGLVIRASGAPLRVGYGDRDGRELNKLFTNRRVRPPAETRHVVERNLALLRGLGVEPPAGPLYAAPALREEELAEARRFFADWGAGWGREGGGGGAGVAALNPGAGWSTKRWPVEHFIALGQRLSAEAGMKILVLWGPKEEPLREMITEGLLKRGVDARPAPPTGLRALAALTSGVRLFVGGDTGPTHLAAALGVPTLGLFGGSEARRNAPWGPRAAALQLDPREDGLPCIPCWKGRCRLTAPGRPEIPCLDRLTPARAFDAATRLLSP